MEKLKYTRLTERESDILRIVVEEFIVENRPVASNSLKYKYKIKFSSATIRNIFARLEHLGFLRHTFTSSGRIPTDLGYRYYVDHFVNTDLIESKINSDVKEQLMKISSNIDELMQETALMLAKVSGLFGVVVISDIRRSVVTEIELISLSSDRIMMVIALRSGLLKSLVLNLDIVVKPSELASVNRTLRERLIGHSIEDIKSSISALLKSGNVSNHEIIQIIFQHPLLPFQLNRNNHLYTSSYNGLLSNPEFQKYDIIQRTISGLDEKNIKPLLTKDKSG